MYGCRRCLIPWETSALFVGPISRFQLSCRASSHADSMAASPEQRSISKAMFQGESLRAESQRDHVARVVRAFRARARWAALSCRVSNAIPSFSIETAMSKRTELVRANPSPRPPGPAKRSITGTDMSFIFSLFTASAWASDTWIADSDPTRLRFSDRLVSGQSGHGRPKCRTLLYRDAGSKRRLDYGGSKIGRCR